MSDFIVKEGLVANGSIKGNIGTVTGNATLDLSTGDVFEVTPTADVTFAFSNPPAAGNAQAFSVALTGVLIDNAYDLANAQPPVYGGFSVVTEESSPQSVFFKSDGLKMYVLGAAGDAVNEYDLSTAWDVSTASYVQNFSVSAEEQIALGLFFKPDGTKMYVTGFSGVDVNEYNLSTAWDVSTASYVQNFSVAAQGLVPTDLFLKPDGTKMYVTCSSNDSVYEYNLSTAWDVSTASYLQSFSVAAEEASPQGLFFKPDGTKMYVAGGVGDDVNEYNLSTAWDVSTASYVQNFSVADQEASLTGVFFKDDGTKMHVIGSNSDAIHRYTLSTAWDISSASWDAPTTDYFNVAAQDTIPTDMFFKTDGTKMFVLGTSGADVNEYDLSTAWDVSSASYLQNFSVAAQDSDPSGLFFKGDGSKMYIAGNTNDSIYEYDLSTAWDISSASYLQNFSINAQDTAPTAVFFKPDGTKMYVLGRTGDAVYEYDLSTAWDISAANYVQNFSVATQETNAQGLFFKSDGTKMYVIGTVGDDVNEYNLSTAWDVSTASYSQNFSVAAQEGYPTGLFFGDNGTKMYVIGINSDAIWQYSTGTYGDATFTYPASVQWSGGTAPTAPATGETDLLTFYTEDGGTTYYGFKVGDALA